EIGDYDVDQPIAVIIARIHPHAGLCPPVGIDTGATGDPYLFESAISQIMKKKVWVRVVGNIDIDSSVVVVVGCQDPETIRLVDAREAQSSGGIAECSIAGVAIEDIGCARQASRSRHHARS